MREHRPENNSSSSTMSSAPNPNPQGRGQHSAALSLLESLSVHPEALKVPARGASAELRGLPGVWAAVRYLRALGQDQLPLIATHSRFAGGEWAGRSTCGRRVCMQTCARNLGSDAVARQQTPTPAHPRNTVSGGFWRRIRMRDSRCCWTWTWIRSRCSPF
jgi:hypothetical protein